MSYELQSLNQVCGERNIPGVKKFQYAPIEWIASFPEYRIDPNTINTAVVFIPGKDWLDGAAVVDTLLMKEIQRLSKQGPNLRVSITGAIAKDTPAINNEFNKMKDYCFIVLITDKNDNIKIVGSVEEPLVFKSDLNTGRKTGDTAGHDFVFSGLLTQKSAFYTA